MFYLCEKEGRRERVLVREKTYLPAGSVLLLNLLNHLQWAEQNKAAWCQAARFLISFLIHPDRLRPGLCCCNPLARYPPVFNMLMSPAEWLVRHVADGLATVSEKTDVSTAPLKTSVCLSMCASPSVQRSTGVFVRQQRIGCEQNQWDNLFQAHERVHCTEKPNKKEAFVCLNCLNH